MNEGHHRASGLIRLIVATGFLVAATALAAPAAQAAPPDEPFDTAKLTLCTDVNHCTFYDPMVPWEFDEESPPQPPPGWSPDWFWWFFPSGKLRTHAATTRAGAPPDFTVKMRRKRNGCHESGSEQFKFANADGLCDRPGDAFYKEQDLKKLVLHMPPGLMADANATPSPYYCDAFQAWGSDGVPGAGEGRSQNYNWYCENPRAAVGVMDVLGTFCLLQAREPVAGGGYRAGPGCVSGYGNLPLNILRSEGILDAYFLGSVVYNERPRPGEQGRLAVLVKAVRNPMSTDRQAGALMKIDIGIKVRESDLGIDVVADDIPGMLVADSRTWGQGPERPPTVDRYKIPIEASDMVMKLKGSIGAEKGHPLLTNPTFCDPQSIPWMIQGYEENSVPVLGSDEPNAKVVDVIPSHGEGTPIKGSVPYQAWGCEAIPYAPTFTATSDTSAPGEPVALNTVITQKDDEATTERVKVDFPKGMGVNLNTSLKPCPADALRAKNCPESSKMGTVEADSRLLPKPPRENSGPLKGNVYLTGLKGDKLTLSMLLKGFIDFRIDGSAGVGSDGTLRATFDDLPSVPLSKFSLNLEGGAKSLITNPRRCVPMTTTANFTSHSGKTHTVNSSMGKIAGCKDPTFEVDLSDRGRGKKTSVELEVRSDQKPIKEIKFALSRHLKWTTKHLTSKRKAKKSAKKKKRVSFGKVSLMTESGEQEGSLVSTQSALDKRKKRKALRLTTGSPLGLKMYLRRFARKSVKSFKVKGNRKNRVLRKKTVGKNILSLNTLPRDEVTRVTVELNSKETKFIRTPKKCKKLHWLAIVKTTDGAKHYLRPKQRAKLNCDKSKRRRR